MTAKFKCDSVQISSGDGWAYTFAPCDACVTLNTSSKTGTCLGCYVKRLEARVAAQVKERQKAFLKGSSRTPESAANKRIADLERRVAELEKRVNK